MNNPQFTWPLPLLTCLGENEAMATTHLEGQPVETAGNLPAPGAQAPAFTLTSAELADVQLSDFAGKKVILNIFPSVDTGICATSVRRFNSEAAGLENTVVLCISQDLPFALGRFCGAEGIENAQTLSAFRSSFGQDYGLTLAESPLAGLLARSVIVLDEQGKVLHSQLVDEIKTEPDYEAALAAL